MIILNEVLNKETITTICKYLSQGYAILIKTDTQWGLMALNDNILYQIKRRPLDKKIVRLVSPNFKLANLSLPQKMFINEFWPGSVTIVVNGDAFRLTNKKFINAILLKLNSMVYCTSANISGCEPINSINEALTVFSHALDKIVMIAPIKENNSLLVEEPLSILSPLPSTIVDIDYWYVIRKGAKYLDVINFIANKIIPYYNNQLDRYRSYINKLTNNLNINCIPNCRNVPIIDLVDNLTNKIKAQRQKQYDEIYNNNLDKSKN